MFLAEIIRSKDDCFFHSEQIQEKCDDPMPVLVLSARKLTWLECKIPIGVGGFQRI